jgi:O-antigen/teichoic acid export membrane protein
MSFSDKFFVQQKTDMSVLAVYTTGITIASVCSLVLMSFQNIWLPVFLKEKNVEINFRRTGKMAKIIGISFAGIAVFMIIGVKTALMFDIIPSSYNDVLKILPFLFVAQIISSINALYGNYFLYFERMTLGALVGGSVYVISFFLNFLLIPHYGVPGAIVALILNSAILLTTVYCVVKKLYRSHKILNHEPADYTVVVPE